MAYQTICTPQPQQTLSMPLPCTPLPPKPHTTTLKIIKAYFVQISPPPAHQGSNQQTKIHLSLKIQFQDLFYTKLQNSAKKLPSPSNSPPPFNTCNSSSGPQIKNHRTHSCLSCQILSKMVLHNLVASKTTKLSHFRQKACVKARPYPVGTGQGYYPPKSYWAST